MNKSERLNYTEEQIQEEIRGGLLEYLENKESPYVDLAEFFEESFGSTKRLDKEQFKEDLNNFIQENIESIVRLINFDYSKKEEELNRMVLDKKITNTDIQTFGINANIEIRNQSEKIVNKNPNYDYYSSDNQMERYNDNGYFDINSKKEFYINEHLNEENILALDFLKENIRRNSKADVGLFNEKTQFAQRFYYKPIERYLNEDDWGMSPYRAEKDVENIENFKNSIVSHFRQVLSNLRLISDLDGNVYDIKNKWLEENTSSSYPDWNLQNENKEEYDRLYKEHQDNIAKAEKYAENVKTRKTLELLKDAEIQRLIFEAIPSEKFFAETHFKKYPEIDRLLEEKIAEMSDDEKVKYVESEEFKGEAKKYIFSDIYTNDNLDGKIITLSNSYKAPIIFGSNRNLESVISEVLQKNRVQVKKEIVDSYDGNELFWEQYNRIIDSDRGGNSEYAFLPEEFYDVFKEIKNLGPKVFAEVVPDIHKDSKYYNSPESDHLLYFYPDISWMEKDRIKKELWHARRVVDSNLIDFFYEKIEDKPEKPTLSSYSSYQEYDENDEEYKKRKEKLKENKNLLKNWEKNKKNWLEDLSSSERKKIFFEAKQMDWTARLVRTKAYDLNNQRPQSWEDDEDEYYFNRNRNDFIYNISDWKKFDLGGLDMEKIKNALEKNGNILLSFLDLEEEKSDLGLKDIIPIIDLIDAGVDLRGIALAYNKKEFAEYILSGNSKNTLEEVLQTWPKNLRENIKDSEFELCWEYANDYLTQDPKGMIRYAEFIEKNPKIRENINGEINKKSYLDFRLALSVQTDEIVNWYLSGAEYVGNETMQNYFMRFNATRESNERYADFHDALYWIESIKNVEPNEAKSLLLDIETMDESRELKDYISRYRKEDDPLKEKGKINSVRELKKMVMAIESNINLSDLDERVLDITAAPGFNLRALESMHQKPEFRDLIDGKYDKEQPFVPYKKIYT